MAEKKFNIYRRVVQNNFTHYNYFYNANNKINLVLERAKAAQKDDFSKLIGYYPYTLENTATQKQELDSVILKATAGILLHDLRNAWIDNMYLLMGKAYFFRKDFDTAAATFQFINYNLFPRKKMKMATGLLALQMMLQAVRSVLPIKKNKTYFKTYGPTTQQE
ncbi:MAG: hypothetical protein IPP72_21380 [Chitinophagaceae bacterium]|nr:hypothetical protein [Chitinophagaceae bacterium]